MSGGSRRSLREIGWVLVVAAAVQALFGWVGARAWLTGRNTLAAHGAWTSTKTTFERGLMGAFSFVTERQSLAGGELNLGAWHGFQEVLYAREAGDVAAIEFDLRLAKGGHLSAIFNRAPDAPYQAFRLSAHWRHPSAFLEVAPDGGFLRKEVLAERRISNGVRHRVRIALDRGRATLEVDGETRGSFEYEPRSPATFGFRGGYYESFVDDVAVTRRDGATLSESFDAPAGAGWLPGAAAAAAVALNLVLFFLLLLATRVGGRRLGFYFLMVNLTLLAVGGALWALVLARSDWYPGLDRVLEDKEAYFRKGAMERVDREVRERFRASEGAGHRILFVGTSQTWGAGAQRGEETWVAQLESLLNRQHPSGGPFVCVNGGVSAARAEDLVPLVREWLGYRPDGVVINLASNDKATPESFEPAIREMVASALAAGSRPVLLMEPNISPGPGLRTRHQDLARVAADLAIPLVDLQTFMNRLADSGFVWWDHVHLTSYGQRRLAEKLYEEMVRLGLPAGAGGPDGPPPAPAPARL